jgi:hypothetical protein
VPPPAAVKLTELVVHVIVVDEGVIEAAGGVVFWFTVPAAVAVHPFSAVTVTVYVPVVPTNMPAVVSPELHR